MLAAGRQKSPYHGGLPLKLTAGRRYRYRLPVRLLHSVSLHAEVLSSLLFKSVRCSLGPRVSARLRLSAACPYSTPGSRCCQAVVCIFFRYLHRSSARWTAALRYLTRAAFPCQPAFSAGFRGGRGAAGRPLGDSSRALAGWLPRGSVSLSGAYLLVNGTLTLPVSSCTKPHFSAASPDGPVWGRGGLYDSPDRRSIAV